MEKFGLSGLWKHLGSTVISAGLVVATGLVEYLKLVQLPSWGVTAVGIAAALLAFYKGKVQTQLAP